MLASTKTRRLGANSVVRAGRRVFHDGALKDELRLGEKDALRILTLFLPGVKPFCRMLPGARKHIVDWLGNFITIIEPLQNTAAAQTIFREDAGL